ncbi:NADPH oxidase [Rhizoctonia solani]|uniref:NADPH oxidase n=1 Tax=Rhizoctonia solani TaxID=456999 RepID=A0A8H7I9P4_9AGAM|nr:NADPH oxidase [Rhizoctonia solani]
MNRTDGLDFADRDPTVESHPDVPRSNLQRNKTERGRLQGLMRINSSTGIPTISMKNSQSGVFAAWKEKWDHWMVNDGGRQLFFGVVIILHLLVFGLGFVHYDLKDNSVGARALFGITFPIARTAALVLHVDAALILLPATAWSIVFFTVIHILAHMVNFTRLGLTQTKQIGPLLVLFLQANFATGPGITGWIMTAALGIMVWFAMEKRRRAHFERFWYSHHLFIVFFINWQLHGMFCMIKPDRPPYCSFNTIGRILREVRSRHRTYISKVIQHPSKVMEVQIKKEKTTTRAGQYIFLNVLKDYISVHIRVVGDFTTGEFVTFESVLSRKEIAQPLPRRRETFSLLEFPFFRLDNSRNWLATHADQSVSSFAAVSFAFSKALGCDFDSKPDKGGEKSKVVGTQANPPINRVLPRVMVDGPFGSASEDFLKSNSPRWIDRSATPARPRTKTDDAFLQFETVLLVGAGIGVTPFASILKSIWYRMNNFNDSKPTRLSKIPAKHIFGLVENELVGWRGRQHAFRSNLPSLYHFLFVFESFDLGCVYFTWVIRDFGTAEWFHSLLHAIEEQDTQNRIEISIYLTAKIKEDDMNNILVRPSLLPHYSLPKLTHTRGSSKQVQDVGAERDAITSLRAPTHFGRPNWDRVFSSIGQKHPETDVGVFFCGPAVLSKTLKQMSNKYTQPKGTRFFFGKENF